MSINPDYLPLRRILNALFIRLISTFLSNFLSVAISVHPNVIYYYLLTFFLEPQLPP